MLPVRTTMLKTKLRPRRSAEKVLSFSGVFTPSCYTISPARYEKSTGKNNLFKMRLKQYKFALFSDFSLVKSYFTSL